MPFMDHFLEEVVVKHRNTLNRIVYYLSWVIMIVSAVLRQHSEQPSQSAQPTGTISSGV